MIENEMDIDDAIAALRGPKQSRAYSAALRHLQQLAEIVDAERNAGPGETSTADCPSSWALRVAVYAKAFRNPDVPEDTKALAMQELREMAAHAQRITSDESDEDEPVDLLDMFVSIQQEIRILMAPIPMSDRESMWRQVCESLNKENCLEW